MKVGIILSIVLTSLTAGERQKRSTVLTDESKRVVEHFDFSSFDKQEALNYLDRQRYENQIRGKRSQSKLRIHNDQTNWNSPDVPLDYIDGKNLLNPDEKSQEFELENAHPDTGTPLEYEDSLNTALRRLDEDNMRNKRGHGRRKHKSKLNDERNELDYEDYDDNSRYKKRKRKKKKKRHYWNHWSEWSPCSVTCGRGRKIRWRKCIIKNCNSGELEMGEKTCQLPACNLLTKLLGL